MKSGITPAYEGAVTSYQDKCWNGLHMLPKSDTVSFSVILKDGIVEHRRNRLL